MKRIHVVFKVLASYCARRAMYWARVAMFADKRIRPCCACHECFEYAAMESKARRREQLWDRRMKRLLVWGGVREGVLRE